MTSEWTNLAPKPDAPEPAPQAAAAPDGPVATDVEGEVKNPALWTIDPVPPDIEKHPGFDPDGVTPRSTNLMGYYVRPVDDQNHQIIIVGHAEPFQVAAREQSGFKFIGYKPEV